MAAPTSPTPVSWPMSKEPAPWLKPLRICDGTPAAVSCGTRSSSNVVAKIVPTKARAMEPPI
jgi:hypothetical protein